MKRIFLISLLMILIPIAMSSFFQLEFKKNEFEMNDNKETGNAVWQLSDGNLVDFMIDLPIQNKLSKVGWDHSTLSIDLNISETLNKPNTVYQDLYSIVHSGLKETKNVKLVLIRVFDQDHLGSGNQKLLMTVDANDSQWSEEMEHLINNREISKEELLSIFFKLKTTDYWEEWMEEIS
ncbi:hypothetical protein [Chengkuizengella axinellae]|uniref:DUF4825 domain-containing protein n=1 Tax=Chengkuizengella axinellae TaxID=3064388 RepID=A0ABT9IYA6_9BACL|nr:hypothetical protein [Chengkuizengella sp. 2205SS18-9]MDP5273794.1 hypothetical protein [Chengkuizengella sp. 2205SS18-9]